MDRSGLIERVGRVETACAEAGSDASSVAAALVAVRELDGWLASRKALLVGRLQEVSSFPEATIADADRTSIGAATKSTERSDTLASTPKLADALGDGAISTGHVDAVTRTS